MKNCVVALSLLLASFTASADCTGKLSVGVQQQTITATFPTSDAPAVKHGDPVSLTIGDTVLKTTVADVTELPAPVSQTLITFDPPAGAKFENGVLKVDADIGSNAAKLAFSEGGEDKSADLCLVGQFNSTAHSLTVGAASASDNSSSQAGAAASDAGATQDTATRIQYKASSRRFREAQNAKPDDILSARLAMTEFAVSIDTTNKKGEKFVDDNSFRAGYYTPRRSGFIFNRVRFGVAAQHSRAFHVGDHNSDATLALDGWLPFFRAFNFGTPQKRLALPLSFRLSAGNRWQDVSGVNSHGPVAEWAFLYHVYLLSDYRLDLEHRTVFNDVKERPATTPRTQHTWKASLFMFLGDDSRFNAVASYENGHSGPVFTQLRQYFLGVGVKNLFGSIK